MSWGAMTPGEKITTAIGSVLVLVGIYSHAHGAEPFISAVVVVVGLLVKFGYLWYEVGRWENVGGGQG